MNTFALAALSLAAKTTVLFAAAAVAAAILRRSRAAARHLAWTLAVAGALALPLASAVAPGWRVPVLPRPAAALATLPAVQVSPTAHSTLSVAGDPARVVDPVDRATSGVDAAGSNELPAVGRSPVIVGDGVRVAGRTVGWMALLACAWLLGAVLVLGRMAVGAWALGRIARSASAPRGEGWSELLRDLCWMTDVERPVRLIQSPDAAMPMTWGIARPVILLPAGAGDWTDERRRVVLLHELAHVARRDCLTQWLAGLACALYWFHPAAWYAARRLRVERERACDERVLAAGTRGADYAAHLLEVARAFRAPTLAAALSVPMARPSQLEGRLLAVLNGARRPATLTRRAGALAALAAAGLVLPLAAMRPAERPSNENDPSHGRPAAASHRTTDAARKPGEAGTPAPAGQTWQAPQDEQTIERTVAARPGGWLVLDLDTGGDVTVQPWDRDQVQVVARLGGRDWRGTRVRVDHDGDLVRVWSQQADRRGSTSTSHRFEVRVPRRFNVRLNSAGGGVAITGVQGSFRGQTGGGPLTLSRLAGDVDLSTGGGQVVVTDSDLRGKVTTGGGGIRLTRVRGGLRGWSGSEGAVGIAEAMGVHAASPDVSDIVVAPRVTVTPHGDGADVHVSVDGTEVHVNADASGQARVEARAYEQDAEQARAEARAASREAASYEARGYAYATGAESERIAAIDAVARNAPEEAAAQALVGFAFEDPSPRVQRASVNALESIAGSDDAAMRGLSRIARTHPSLATRRAAVAALARCRCETSTRALREVARADGDADLRRAARRALEQRAGTSRR